MKIYTTPPTSISPIQKHDMNKSGNDFSSLLRGNIAANSTNKNMKRSEGILSEIMDKGLMQYAQEKRDEEIRDKILSAMGINEAVLEEMSPDQRLKIEGIIEEAITAEKLKRMSVASDSRSEDASKLPLTFF